MQSDDVLSDRHAAGSVVSNQPRWAWWVVGIVIPVTGILVSIQLATNSGSGDETQGAAAPNGGRPAPTSGAAGSQAANAPAKVLAGPMTITLKEGANYIDLDGPSPVPQPGGKGADATVGFNLPDLALGPPKSGDVVAILPSEGAAPTRDECAQAIAKRGTYTSGELAQGMRLCLQTDEGHTAYLRVTGVPTRSGLTFEATVWE